MKISYDPEIDAVYIRLIEGKHECRTVHLSEEVALNLGAGENLIGIEVLDATQTLGTGEVPSIVIEGFTSSGTPLGVREKPGKLYRGFERRRIGKKTTSRDTGD